VAAGEERVFVELTAIVKMLERALYGITSTRSERLRSDRPRDEQIAFSH
jgi:hypothetical protein